MMKTEEKLELAEKARTLRGEGLQWKQVGLQLGVSHKFARDVVVWADTERYHSEQWYSGMSPDLRRAILGNVITSLDKLKSMRDKYGDQLRFSLKNFGPKLERELKEWMTLHITD